MQNTARHNTFPRSIESQLLMLLYRNGPMSRWNLHELTGLRPNTVSSAIGRLLDRAFVEEKASEPFGRGRPPIPVGISDTGWGVLGLAIEPGKVSVCRMNPHGRRVGKQIQKSVKDPKKIVAEAARLLDQVMTDRIIAVGLNVPGIMDPGAHVILLSSSIPGEAAVDLEPICNAARGVPVVLENDMHALAAQRMLAQQAEDVDDALLVTVRDGAIGAALLVDGKPNRGCAVGGNELGHTRLMVETDPCNCGRSGCLARIWSTTYLRSLETGGSATLSDRLARFQPQDEAVSRMVGYLAVALGNAINLVRPNRLVLISEDLQHTALQTYLIHRIRDETLSALRDRVKVIISNAPVPESATTAGWLALASVYAEGWRQNVIVPR